MTADTPSARLARTVRDAARSHDAKAAERLAYILRDLSLTLPGADPVETGCIIATRLYGEEIATLAYGHAQRARNT